MSTNKSKSKTNAQYTNEEPAAVESEMEVNVDDSEDPEIGEAFPDGQVRDAESGALLPLGETEANVAVGVDLCYEEEEEDEDDEEMEVTEVVDNKKRMTLASPITDDAEIDFETLVREEFKKLHRQYRLMEDARHAIAGASGKLGKQGRLLERLRDEKEDLLTDLKNAKCRAYRMKDKQSINTILEALERYEKYKADITACLLSIAEMESNVDRITQRLVEQRLKVQALYGQSLTVSKAEHRKRILEDKLYLATTQMDTLVTQNKELKVEINMMLKLRGSFYRRMLHIKRVSAKIKQRLGEVVYEATAAYDQRDDSINKYNILRERNDKDSKQHVLEIKEFQRVLHHDSKAHEFLAIKNKTRELLENTSQRLERQNRGKISELDQLLNAYKRSFKAILIMANSRDLDAVVNHYLEEEHTNYAMFKYITDLNHEINSLQEDIRKIKQEIESLSAQAKEISKMQKDVLSVFDEKIEEASEKLDTTQNECSQADQVLEEFGNNLDEAFNLAGCSNAPIVALLGNQGGMGPRNICLCMKALEHRITELLFEKGMWEVRKAVELEGNPVPKKPQLWIQGTKPPPQGGPFKPIVHVTGRVDSEQEDEDAEVKAWSERPIYYAEMKDIIKQSMQTMVVADVEGSSDPSKPRPSTAVLMEKPNETPSQQAQQTPSAQSQATKSNLPTPAQSEHQAAPPEPEQEPEPQPEPAEPDSEPETAEEAPQED